MASKKGKGGKNKRKGKKQAQNSRRDLEFKDESQEYAQVTKMLGNSRVEVLCLLSNRVVIGTIRGTFRKRVWINQGDIVLLGLRDFQDDKADVILKYTPDEARLLKAYGEIPESVTIGSGGAGGNDAGAGDGDDNLAFAEGDEEEAQPKSKSNEEDDELAELQSL